MKKMILFVSILATSMFGFTACVQNTNYAGRTIGSVNANAPVKYLTQSELMTLINGKVIIGESIKNQKWNTYYKITMHKDGTTSSEIHKKDGGRFIKNGTPGKWLIKKDGILCTEKNGVQYCNKKVCKVGEKYLSVIQKNGKIFSSWSVVEK